MLYDFLQSTPRSEFWVAILLIAPLTTLFLIAYAVGNPPQNEDRTLRLWSRWPNDLLSTFIITWGFIIPALTVLVHGGTAIDLVPILAIHALLFSGVCLFEQFFNVQRYQEFLALIITHFIVCGVLTALVALGGSL